MGELTESALVRRATERFGFGTAAGELPALQQAGMTAWRRRLDSSPATDPGAAATPVPALAEPDPVGANPTKEQRKHRLAGQRRAMETLTVWWLDRMTRADDQATERLTWFWHGHFATSAQKVKVAALMLRQNSTLRAGALGSFARLAHEMIVDPALLVWLDGNRNTSKAPNENLAREFMELFTLGHGHYTEGDVAQAARALSGWKVARDTGRVHLASAQHDDYPKTILGRTADFDAGSFAALVLQQPASPVFVVGRLWARLVSATPPSPATLGTLVRTWGPSGDVRATCRAIVAQPEFADAASTLVKQPVEWLVGLNRALDVQVGSLTPEQHRKLLASLTGMGQLPFRPPSVGGWPAGRSWLTSAAALSRLQAARIVAGAANLGEIARTTAQNRPEAVRRLLGVETWSRRTAAALDAVAATPVDTVVTAACAPEYVVSA